MTQSLAKIAEEQFRQRQAKARRMVAAAEVDLARAEAAMRPWAALVRFFGGQLPEIAGWVDIDICPRDRVRATLAIARDQALDRGDYEAGAPLIALAVAYRCPPYIPPSLRPRQSEPVQAELEKEAA